VPEQRVLVDEEPLAVYAGLLGDAFIEMFVAKMGAALRPMATVHVANEMHLLAMRVSERDCPDVVRVRCD
jgi:hypothetical protein